MSLADAVAQQISKLESSGVQADLLEEWKEFFSGTIYPPMLCLFVDLATASEVKQENIEGDEDDVAYHIDALLACLGTVHFVHFTSSQDIPLASTGK